jgi:hypothetical protein
MIRLFMAILISAMSIAAAFAEEASSKPVKQLNRCGNTTCPDTPCCRWKDLSGVDHYFCGSPTPPFCPPAVEHMKKE